MLRTTIQAITRVATVAGSLAWLAGAVLWVASLAHPLVAQAPARDPHTAQPERPTVATHAGTVARGWLEFESGVESDRGPGDSKNSIFTTVAKLGVGARAQLAFNVNASMPDPGGSGIGDASIGLKWRLAEAHPLLGDFAVQPGVKFPTGSVREGTGTGTTDVSLLLISSRDLGPVHLDLNAGYTLFGSYRGSTQPGQLSWTASFGGLFGESATTGWVAELFGYPGTGGSQGAAARAGFLFGPTFTVRSWLVLDAGAIVPVVGGQPHALYAGATYNVGRVF